LKLPYFIVAFAHSSFSTHSQKILLLKSLFSQWVAASQFLLLDCFDWKKVAELAIAALGMSWYESLEVGAQVLAVTGTTKAHMSLQV
jgi:hypothetical protein